MCFTTHRKQQTSSLPKWYSAEDADQEDFYSNFAKN